MQHTTHLQNPTHSSPFPTLPCHVAQHIKEHFADDVSKLAEGGYDDWLQQPLSALAGIVLADQFTRCAAVLCQPAVHTTVARGRGCAGCAESMQ